MASNCDNYITSSSPSGDGSYPNDHKAFFKTSFIKFRSSINYRQWPYGLNLLIYFTPKVWDMIPLEIKDIYSLQKSKTEIRKWATEMCSCYLCRPYMQNLGFVELV